MKKRVSFSIRVGAIIGVFALGANVSIANGIWHSAHVGGPDACVGFGAGPGCDKNWSLVALQFDDLSVTGEFTDRWLGSKGVHATVDCLYVYDNFAFVGGPITDGDFVGFYFFAIAVDNGQTAQDPPDQLSYTYIVPPPSEFFNCEEIPFVFPFLLEDIFDAPQGQVKVK